MKPPGGLQTCLFTGISALARLMISFRSVLSSDQAKRTKRAAGGLAQQAYLKIRERILSGKMPFGASISRRELSAELGMSTLPVSDALRRLEDEKLIQSVPRVGTVVRIPTRQDVIGFRQVILNRSFGKDSLVREWLIFGMRHQLDFWSVIILTLSTICCGWAGLTR